MRVAFSADSLFILPILWSLLPVMPDKPVANGLATTKKVFFGPGASSCFW
jgi:hypothetical protein